jgi:succinate dehydrogenase / fumarate reductase iron-sulfur subunit
MQATTFRASGAATRTAAKAEDYTTEVTEGMVVLDAVHQIQADRRPTSRCRWNCKAGKCGSCSAEVNGKPRLMCMTRLNDLALDEPVTIEPMPPSRTSATSSPTCRGTSRSRSGSRSSSRASPTPRRHVADAQADVDRVQEFRKCIECFLCQDVCHVLRDHHKHDEFIGPRFFVYTAALEMHPLDTEDRLGDLKDDHGIGYCNITKCCTKVCPEHITITDNAIIPLKEARGRRVLRPALTDRTSRRAEAVRPPGNDDARLRWNACARLLNAHPNLREIDTEPATPLMLE